MREDEIGKGKATRSFAVRDEMRAHEREQIRAALENCDPACSTKLQPKPSGAGTWAGAETP
jgi:hypothetical protein